MPSLLANQLIILLMGLESEAKQKKAEGSHPSCSVPQVQSTAF